MPISLLCTELCRRRAGSPARRLVEGEREGGEEKNRASGVAVPAWVANYHQLTTASYHRVLVPFLQAALAQYGAGGIRGKKEKEQKKTTIAAQCSTGPGARTLVFIVLEDPPHHDAQNTFSSSGRFARSGNERKRQEPEEKRGKGKKKKTLSLSGRCSSFSRPCFGCSRQVSAPPEERGGRKKGGQS